MKIEDSSSWKRDPAQDQQGVPNKVAGNVYLFENYKLELSAVHVRLRHPGKARLTVWKPLV